jgi:hypothetical protein
MGWSWQDKSIAIEGHEKGTEMAIIWAVLYQRGEAWLLILFKSTILTK